MTIPEMLTVEEAAAKLRRSPHHVRYMLRKKQIAGRKLVEHGPWLIPASVIANILTGEPDGKHQRPAA